MPDEVKEKLIEKLGSVSYDMPPSVVESRTFYQVPFTDVLNLVALRKVFLYKVCVVYN